MVKRINRTELVKALEKTKPGLASKEMIEQSSSFVFTNGMIVTYNDEISVTHPFEALKDIEGAVKAEELHDLLEKMEDEEIEVDIVENEFRINGERVRAGLAIEKEIKLPIKSNTKIKKWQRLPNDFLEVLKFVMFSCSEDMTKPVLTCVNVTPFYLEASDGFRVTRRNLSDKLSISHAFLLPKSSAEQVVRYDAKNIYAEEEWVHFQTEDGVVLSCRVFSENYPDIESLGILNVQGIELRLPSKLSDVVERVAVFAKKQELLGAEVSVKIADKKFTVRGQSDYGWVEEECRINYNKDPIRFSTNPHFLKDIVTLTQKCTIGNEKMKFVGDGWVHVLALSSNDKEEK